jgi:hypothetical protein
VFLYFVQMLNCILSMVEKTKRALAILQHRPPAPASVPEPDFLQSASWLQRRAPPEGAEQQDIKKTAGEIMAQTIKATEDRVAEVRRRAGEHYYIFADCNKYDFE